MTESINQQTDIQQPHRPIRRDAQRYDVLREAEQQAVTPIAVASTLKNHELFTMIITATSNKGGAMDSGQDERQFLMNVIFKPSEKRLRLSPQLSQLLLAHIGEILSEVEEEEKRVIAEQETDNNMENTPCK